MNSLWHLLNKPLQVGCTDNCTNLVPFRKFSIIFNVTFNGIKLFKNCIKTYKTGTKLYKAVFKLCLKTVRLLSSLKMFKKCGRNDIVKQYVKKKKIQLISAINKFSQFRKIFLKG